MRAGIVRMMLVIGLGAASAVGARDAAIATVVPEGGASAATVRELIAAANMQHLMQQMIGQMGQQVDLMVQQRLPCLPPHTVSAVFTTPQATQQLIDLMVPIYQRHFTEQDVRALLAFYRTPVGQKMLREQPKIMVEAMAAGQQFGRQAVEQRLGELQKQGVLDAQGMCPATQLVPSAPASASH